MTGRAEQQNWEYEVQDLSYLADACWIEDEIARLRAELEGAPRITKGSMKRDVANPLVSEVRHLVNAKAAFLKDLAIPDETPARSDTPMTRGQVVLKGAQARWRMHR